MKAYRCNHAVEAARWEDTDAMRHYFADWFDFQGAMFETRGPVVILPEGDEVQPGERVVFDGRDFIVMTDENFRDCYVEAA